MTIKAEDFIHLPQKNIQIPKVFPLLVPRYSNNDYLCTLFVYAHTRIHCLKIKIKLKY